MEKVIKGLECCTMEAREGLSPCQLQTTGESCPYWVAERCCVDELLADTHEFIKSQMPRVLTLGEALGTLEAVYFEHEKCCFWTDAYMSNDMLHAELQRFGAPPVYLPLESYGKAWRCWNKKPTDEQRRLTMWD